MKKVCIMTTVHPRFDIRVFHKEAKSLAKEYDTVLLCADGKGNEIVDGVSIRSIACIPNNRCERILRVTKDILMEALKIDADIYHFHDAELLPAAKYLKKCGKKVIYDVHEDLPSTVLEKKWIPKPCRKLLSFCIEWYENNVSKIFDVVITATPFIESRFNAVGANAVAVCNFPRVEEFPNTGDWAERKRELCYIGVCVTEDRGVIEMTQAAYLTGMPLHLFGEIRPSNLKDKLSKIDVEKRIVYHGRVENWVVRDMLRQVKIGLVTEYPTDNALNAYCVKMFEYMVSGIPVISSDVPLWKQIVEDNNCGICVNPYDSKAIADAINFLIENEKLAETMGANGRKAIIEKYNWEQQEKRLLNIYKLLLEESYEA